MNGTDREEPRNDKQPEGCLLCDLQTVIADKTMYPDLAERQERAAERLMDDERLTSDLTDDQAQPLMDWAMYQIALAAGNPTCSDSQLEEIITAIRRAIFHVASIANDEDEHDTERLVALVHDAFRQLSASDAPAGSTETKHQCGCVDAYETENETRG